RRLASGVDSQMNLPIIAEVDGEPIGLAWGRIDTSDPDVAVLYQMWVAPSHRGAGAGRRLVETVIAWARVRNVSSVDLGVTCGDSPARRLYERAGFKPIGRSEEHTSELQSRGHLVCRLLLEKKKHHKPTPDLGTNTICVAA